MTASALQASRCRGGRRWSAGASACGGPTTAPSTSATSPPTTLPPAGRWPVEPYCCCAHIQSHWLRSAIASMDPIVGMAKCSACTTEDSLLKVGLHPRRHSVLYDDGEREAVLLACEKLKWLLPPEVPLPPPLRVLGVLPCPTPAHASVCVGHQLHRQPCSPKFHHECVLHDAQRTAPSLEQTLMVPALPIFRWAHRRRPQRRGTSRSASPAAATWSSPPTRMCVCRTLP
jgi:hypothetical protein